MSSSTLNLAHSVFSRARTSPQSVAVVAGGQSYSYEQLASSAGRVAAWLRDQVCKDGKPPRVGILAARSFETYAGILGTLWAGGTYVPLNPKQPPSRLACIAEQAKLDAVVVDGAGLGHVQAMAHALPHHLLLPDDAQVDLVDRSLTAWGALAAYATPSEPALVAADDWAYIIFTSGTTGVPKGVVVTVGNVQHFLSCMREMYHLGPADRVAQFFETSFDVSVSEMFACWDGGASLHVIPDTKVMAPAGFMREHEITFWMSVPSAIVMMAKLKQLKPGAFPSMRVSIFGGEGFTVDSAKAWQAAAPNSVVDNLYGPTEATVACLLQRLTDPPLLTPGRGTLAIGKPYVGMEAAIVAPDGRFLENNEVGELAVSGPQVAHGYFNDAERTARRFPELDHPRLGRSRWYLTGDLAMRDDAGLFQCLGRIDNQVKVMGHRVELEEVESHLRRLCGTDCVAAVAWPLVNGHAQGIVGFVSGGGVIPAAVRDELRQRVPAYMVPGKLLEVESLPLSINGKVDRQALCRMLEQGVAV